MWQQVQRDLVGDPTRCPLTYHEYLRYLKSGHWRRLRLRLRARAGDRCEACGARRDPMAGVVLECHHKTYERLGRERDEDMAVLCQSCHSLAHSSWDPFR
jgi:hypothetical protein